jgi:hypothetical protein
MSTITLNIFGIVRYREHDVNKLLMATMLTSLITVCQVPRGEIEC